MLSTPLGCKGRSAGLEVHSNSRKRGPINGKRANAAWSAGAQNGRMKKVNEAFISAGDIAALPQLDAVPCVFRRVNAGLEMPPLSGRCLFANHCLCIKLLGLSAGDEVGACFAGSSGMLMVTHGALEARGHAIAMKLTEGDVIPLPLPDSLELWPIGAADILFFEKKP